jgi:HNH endonuclease
MAAVITRDSARGLLYYFSDTGGLVWKTGRRKGKVAGHVNSRGYRVVWCGGRLLRAHRVIWLWMTGEWPEFDVDHQNRVRDDNRWSNLREATRSENMGNSAGPRRREWATADPDRQALVRPHSGPWQEEVPGLLPV